MRCGAVLRKDLESLIVEDEDYAFLSYFMDKGVVVEDFSFKSSYDVVFYFPVGFSLERMNSFSSLSAPVIINSPKAVVETSSKSFEFFHYPFFQPDSLLVSEDNLPEARFFLKDYSKVVSKPLDGYGGEGVELVSSYDDVLSAVSKYGSVILQEYIPNDGDIRVFVYAGEVVGFLKRYNPDLMINNLSAGGRVIHIDSLSKTQLKRASIIADDLFSRGVVFAGLDFIDDYLIEVNTRMPGALYTLKNREFVYGRMYDLTVDLLK